jgi:hypothetical protein
MKLMVAGCSFSAVSQTLPGTAWSEVLAEKIGADLTNLARQGCSNGGIRLQIDEIIRQRPDFAVVSATFWDRMEIPANSAPYDWSQAPSSGENPPLERHLQDRERGNGYRKQDGIRNVNYGREPSNMICETIFTLAENFDHPYRMARISREAQRGIRAWIDSIYDNAWKKQCDEWIMRDGVMQMYYAGIKFLFLPNLLWPFDPNNAQQWRQVFPAMLPDCYVNLDPANSPQSICGNNPFAGSDPGYHSSPAGQAIIAENFYRHWSTHFK